MSKDGRLVVEDQCRLLMLFSEVHNIIDNPPGARCVFQAAKFLQAGLLGRIFTGKKGSLLHCSILMYLFRSIWYFCLLEHNLNCIDPHVATKKAFTITLMPIFRILTQFNYFSHKNPMCNWLTGKTFGITFMPKYCTLVSCGDAVKQRAS